MFKPARKSHPTLKILNDALLDLPAPINLSIFWNFGSLLGLCLLAQIMTGLFLSMHYTAHIDHAFSSITHISQDVNFGWLIRAAHANGASWFFICLYTHMARGLYYGSFLYKAVWYSGILLLILTMATAFVGYVLVWGQMSFWGATVITNLLSAIPYVGPMLVEWIWGGFAVDNATLNRFFTFHFILPFIIAALTTAHLLALHSTGSNNPLGLCSNQNKIPFHPFYTTKDLMGYAIVTLMFAALMLIYPNLFGDPENFTPANPLLTPPHIMPEWYFLWAYAILRSIPNKLGGVMVMFSAILILAPLPILMAPKRRSLVYYPIAQYFFWSLVATLFLLTWVGSKPVEAPYELLGATLTALYFMLLLLLLPISAYLSDRLLTKP